MLLMACVASSSGCARQPDPDLRPDSVLRAELGLSDADQVYRIVIRGGPQEELTPAQVELTDGAWLEFVSADWRVHEVRFEADSLSGPALAFLTGSDQLASPPLVDRDARFVVSFAGAPEGRYPFVVDGNRAPSRGVVVVRPNR